MKKLIFTISIVFLFSVSAFSQLVFQRIGGDTTYGATGSNYAYAFYRNNGTTPVEIRFKRIINDLPDSNWTSSRPGSSGN